MKLLQNDLTNGLLCVPSICLTNCLLACRMEELDATGYASPPDDFDHRPIPGSTERNRRKRKRSRIGGDLSARLNRIIARVKSDTNVKLHTGTPLAPRYDPQPPG